MEKFDWAFGTLINKSLLQVLIEALSARNPIYRKKPGTGPFFYSIIVCFYGSKLNAACTIKTSIRGFIMHRFNHKITILYMFRIGF